MDKKDYGFIAALIALLVITWMMFVQVGESSFW
jgi:Flp pilus assembly pilin Flp